MQKNLTVELDEQIIIKSKQKALLAGKSLSTIVSELLCEYCGLSKEQKKVKNRALARLERGFKLDGKPYKREEIYNRPHHSGV